MNLTATAAGLVVIVLGILPALPGDHLYRALAGVSWREKETAYFLRLLAFSVIGLVIYAVFAARFGWPPAEHVIPGVYLAPTFSGDRLAALGVGYFGHLVGSTAVALLAVGLNHLLVKIRTVSGSRDSWDHFVRCSVPGHWIAVALQNGDAYAGILDHADVSTEPEFRDLLLAEPYLFDAKSGQYNPTYQQYLFIRGSDVASIAAVHEPSTDVRVVPVAETPFMEKKSEP